MTNRCVILHISYPLSFYIMSIEYTHLSAFEKLSKDIESHIYPYNDILPKQIINPRIDTSTEIKKPIPILPDSSNYSVKCLEQSYANNNNMYLSFNKIGSNMCVLPNIKKTEKLLDKQRMSQSYKEALQLYMKLKYLIVKCMVCNHNYCVTDTFAYSNGYICVPCSTKEYSSSLQLKDWCKSGYYPEKEFNCSGKQHSRELFSFIYYSQTNRRYEISNLCIFCRNVQKFEYLQLQKKLKSRKY